MGQATPSDPLPGNQALLPEDGSFHQAGQPSTASVLESVVQLGVSAFGLMVVIGGAWFLAAHPGWMRRMRRIVPLPVPVGLLISACYLVLTVVPLIVGTGADEQAAEMTLDEMAFGLLASAGIMFPFAIIWQVAVRQARHAEHTGAASSQRTGRTAPVGVGRTILIAVLTFVLAYPVISLANLVSGMVALWIMQEPAPRIAHDTLTLLQSSGGINLPTFIIVGYVIIMAPVIEETIYRGTFQTLVGRLGFGPCVSIVPVALLFGLSHFDIASPVALPTLVTLGLVLGLAYEYTGRLLAPMIIHALFNTAQLVMLFLLTRSDAVM